MAEIYWRIKEKALANKLNLLANAFIVFISLSNGIADYISAISFLYSAE